MVFITKKFIGFCSNFKGKFNQIVKDFSRTETGQKLILYLIVGYIKLVFLTSRKVFINQDLFLQMFKNKQPLIIAGWHNRIMMCPFVVKQIKKVNNTDKISSLSSKHGDGKFVGKIMEKFGANNIYGSSKAGRRADKGIDMHGLKDIFRTLKNGLGLVISPDGPRGPANKINGEIIKIAKFSKVPILPAAIGYSKFIELNTWDKFKLPLPFGKICYCYGDLFVVNENVEGQDIANLNLLLEEKINQTAQTADKNCQI